VARGGDGGPGRPRCGEGGRTARRGALAVARDERAGMAGAGGRGEAAASGRRRADIESEWRERRRRKNGSRFISFLCRVPVIWHPAKTFLKF
jgi:hypothetical protein